MNEREKNKIIIFEITKKLIEEFNDQLKGEEEEFFNNFEKVFEIMKKIDHDLTFNLETSCYIFVESLKKIFFEAGRDVGECLEGLDFDYIEKAKKRSERG